MNNVPMEKATQLEAMIRAFSPRPLVSDTDLSKFYYDNTMPIRTGDQNISPLDDLFEDCTMPLGANAHLLSGHGGCGKSTEFSKLKQRFEQIGQPTCIINSQQEMNLNLADCWDIMLFIAYGLCRIADQKKIKLPNATLRAMFEYIKKDMEEIETKDTTSSFDMGVVLNLFASIKSNLQFGKQTRTIIKEKMERRASVWLQYVNEISDTITSRLDGKQPILIFEDLDKIQPYERAFDIFFYDTLAKMPFPIIFSFPIAATYDSRFASIASLYKPHMFPMIKVSNEDKSENREGIEVIKKIVERRADIQLFEEDALEILIKQTGGVLRHLFECIITASRRARRRDSSKIEQEDALRALSDMTAMLTRLISMDDYPMLTNIILKPEYSQHIENRDSLLRLMHGLIVLEYKNGNRWQDVHPQITGFLKKQGVINAAKNAAG